VGLMADIGEKSCDCRSEREGFAPKQLRPLSWIGATEALTRRRKCGFDDAALETALPAFIPDTPSRQRCRGRVRRG